MSRDPRYIPEGGALVEITSTTIQGRYLLRPDSNGRLNDVVVGVFGRAQRREGMAIVGLSVLSTHYHLLAVPRDAQQMARFMKQENGIAVEVISVVGDMGPREYREMEALEWLRGSEDLHAFTVQIAGRRVVSRRRDGERNSVALENLLNSLAVAFGRLLVELRLYRYALGTPFGLGLGQ